ncbi:hypothetical protein [Chitinophaga barathri]|uniref:Uncharacterized protein n=1 Tax=Chitinophaga barathri TaxID=1647451 RepID=A0A3N4M4B2_9BACT|nr:hypothetical protein [Chitinophaga barathri]RPD37884.1 hypothetical protein EG028_27780 [Chitinophaga barathri]
MENGKITIEIPVGKTHEEIRRILASIESVIRKNMPQRRIAEADEILQNSVWPQGLEELLKRSVPTK